MKTMGDKWALFEASVLRGNTNADGMELGKLSFYSGAAALMGVLLQPMEPDERQEILEAVDRELRAFRDNVRMRSGPNLPTHDAVGHG